MKRLRNYLNNSLYVVERFYQYNENDFKRKKRKFTLDLKCMKEGDDTYFKLEGYL